MDRKTLRGRRGSSMVVISYAMDVVVAQRSRRSVSMLACIHV